MTSSLGEFMIIIEGCRDCTKVTISISSYIFGLHTPNEIFNLLISHFISTLFGDLNASGIL